MLSLQKKNEIFQYFPSELKSVAPKHLKPAADGIRINKQPNHLLVVSSFGLSAGLLRQRASQR